MQANVFIYTLPGSTYRHEAWKIALRLADEAEELGLDPDIYHSCQEVVINMYSLRGHVSSGILCINVVATEVYSLVGYVRETTRIIVMKPVRFGIGDAERNARDTLFTQALTRYEALPENISFRDLMLDLDLRSEYVCPVCGLRPDPANYPPDLSPRRRRDRSPSVTACPECPSWSPVVQDCMAGDEVSCPLVEEATCKLG